MKNIIKNVIGYIGLILAFMLMTMSLSAQVQGNDVRYGKENIDGIDIFFREAGNPDKQTVVLLHGYPSSSFMYRKVLAALGDEYYLIAPDYPGYGYSDAPDPAKYTYNFDNVADTMDKFLKQRGLKNYVLMIHDFGAPIGYRIATKNPEKVDGFVVMNGNAYEEGLSPLVYEFLKKDRNPATDQQEMEKEASLEALKWQYTHGTLNPETINPDTWNIDYAVMSKPYRKALNADMRYDYKNNLPLYPIWQQYLRKNQPPMLIVWGKNDKIFIEPGAAAYKKDVKNIDYHILDTGHFALEEEAPFIIEKMRKFLKNIK